MPTTYRRPLTERQLRFVAEYLIDFNGSKAAERAGYAELSARKIACELLKHPEISRRINEHRDKVRKALHERVELNTQHTLQTIAAVQDFDPADMVHPDGTPKNIREMPHSARMALAGFKVTTQWVGKGENRRKVVTTEVKLANRLQAADMAAKVAGAYKADNEQRRSTREMSDEDLDLRVMEIVAKATAVTPAKPASTEGAPPGTTVQ